MKRTVQKEVKKLIEKIEKLELHCTIREFQDKVSWDCISSSQKLSEEFIREFLD